MCVVNWTLLLEYLKLFFNWPFLATVLVAVFLWLFKQEISERLKAITSVKVAGQAFDFSPPVQSTTPVPAINLPTTPAPVATNAPVDKHVTEDAKYFAGPGADIPRAVDWVAQNPGPAISDFLKIVAELHFERTFHLIFGTQIAALDYLAAKNVAVKESDLMPFFEEHLQKRGGKPEVNIQEYLAYLVSQRLVDLATGVGPRMYSINTGGRRFLEYIKSQYSAQWALRAW